MNDEQKRTGGPAFPLPLGWGNRSEPDESGGMSLRDFFAATALQGWLASFAGSDVSPVPDECAELAYELADAMIAAREVTK